MKKRCQGPFEAIESAHEYLGLLLEVVTESRETIVEDLSGTAGSRRQDALNLIAYNLEKLNGHLQCSRRILNDLRTLRRLLHQQRDRIAA